MCYPSPGPRCSSSARKQLVNARRAYNRYSGFDQKREELKLKVSEAEASFYTTPAGLAELHRLRDEQAKRGRDDKVSDYNFKIAMFTGQRAAMLAAVKANSDEDYGIGSHTVGGIRRYSPSKLRQRGEYSSQFTKDWSLLDDFNNDSENFAAKLTVEQNLAIRKFTSDGSVLLNHFYGKGKPNNEEAKYDFEGQEEEAAQLRSTLHDVFSKADKQTRVAFRGVDKAYFPEGVTEAIYSDDPSVRSNMIKGFLEENGLKKGSVVTTSVPASYSADPIVASSFADGDVIFEVETRSSVPVGTVSAWTDFERELVVPDNVKFQVVNIKEDSVFVQKDFRNKPFKRKRWVVQMREI